MNLWRQSQAHTIALYVAISLFVAWIGAVGGISHGRRLNGQPVAHPVAAHVQEAGEGADGA